MEPDPPRRPADLSLRLSVSCKPQLQFARFKTHSGYAEMRTDALRFTDVEIDDLFRDIYNDPLDPMELVELEQRTEGWAASLQLVEVSLRERLSPDDRRTFIESITCRFGFVTYSRSLRRRFSTSRMIERGTSSRPPQSSGKLHPNSRSAWPE